jgi:hypothetical protein
MRVRDDKSFPNGLTTAKSMNSTHLGVMSCRLFEKGGGRLGIIQTSSVMIPTPREAAG